ncbi:hypothetical protein V500_10248, partial [Pseudogymnoascus sp. VKM F-4518 (FW-2643)]
MRRTGMGFFCPSGFRMSVLDMCKPEQGLTAFWFLRISVLDMREVKVSGGVAILLNSSDTDPDRLLHLDSSTASPRTLNPNCGNSPHSIHLCFFLRTGLGGRDQGFAVRGFLSAAAVAGGRRGVVGRRGMGGSYEDAIALLDTRRRIRRPSGALATAAARDAGLRPEFKVGGAVLKGKPGVVGMSGWMEELGHSPADVAALNIIHVAGTKGKGSTCAYIEALLLAHGADTGWPQRVGMYTSPHLLVPQERVRISGTAIDERGFARYFFEVWERLFSGPAAAASEKGERPRYLQLCVLVALHAFIREGVGAVVLETHHGGEFDATNFVAAPVVTVVTPLGRDHVKQLGPGMGEIAWHKAGIFKAGAVAIAAAQEEGLEEVLRARAGER